MKDIDVDACAVLLRAATDQIAASSDRPDQTGDIGGIIQWVRSRSEEAASLLRTQLHHLHPDIGWKGEEQRPDKEDTAYWVYDPIDGAYLFLQGLPLWSSTLSRYAGGRPQSETDGARRI